MGRRTLSLRPGETGTPGSQGGKGLEGGATELLIAKATRWAGDERHHRSFFRLAGSRPIAGSPEPRRAASSEPAPSFPVGRGDPAPSTAGDRGAVSAREPGVVGIPRVSMPSTSPP